MIFFKKPLQQINSCQNKYLQVLSMETNKTHILTITNIEWTGQSA